MSVVAGCDGGGTKCHVRVVVSDDSGMEISGGDHISGPANIGTDQHLALKNIQAATNEAMQMASLPIDSTIDVFVCALAGAGDPDRRRQIQRLIADVVQTRKLRIVPDAEILFAAGNVEEPAVATIIGTGSIAWTKMPDGSMRRAGGLGPRDGDEGSAYWIGREAIRRMTAEGHRSENAVLADHIRKRLSFEKANSEELEVGEIASLSKDVFQLADSVPLARAIVTDSAKQIEALIVSAAEGIETSRSSRLRWVCAGGVAVNQPEWLATIRENCRQRNVFLTRPLLIDDPVSGAVKLALRMASDG